MQLQCYKKKNDIINGKLEQNNYALSNRNVEDIKRLFVKQHEINFIVDNATNDDYV